VTQATKTGNARWPVQPITTPPGPLLPRLRVPVWVLPAGAHRAVKHAAEEVRR
jgi:hypothetical protein